ncbi:MAG: hypothetical protein GWO02_01285 [Gammaproteobacteria bacterium]|nr:hypothetical protein [Gammaproteobacteria bacterium]
MTKTEAERLWRRDELPAVRARYERDGRRDEPARAESWSAFTDALCKAGRISIRQYESWTTPR